MGNNNSQCLQQKCGPNEETANLHSSHSAMISMKRMKTRRTKLRGKWFAARNTICDVYWNTFKGWPGVPVFLSLLSWTLCLGGPVTTGNDASAASWVRNDRIMAAIEGASGRAVTTRVPRTLQQQQWRPLWWLWQPLSNRSVVSWALSSSGQVKHSQVTGDLNLHWLLAAPWSEEDKGLL